MRTQMMQSTGLNGKEMRMNREELIEWLCTNDPNGVYRDEDSIIEGMDVLTYEEAYELYLNQSKG